MILKSDESDFDWRRRLRRSRSLSSKFRCAFQPSSGEWFFPRKWRDKLEWNFPFPHIGTDIAGLPASGAAFRAARFSPGRLTFSPPEPMSQAPVSANKEAQMILKVTVLKNGVDIFSVDIDVKQPSELSAGVKAALDEFHRVSPKTPVLDGGLQIQIDKAG